MDHWTEIKHLRLEGLGVGEIARRLGLDRKTVRKYVQRADSPVTVERDPGVSLLDPHKDHIRRRLQEHPALSARRLWGEARKAGYAGSYKLVQRFVATLRSEQAIPAVIRFESEPGRQGQVDWAHCGYIEEDGQRVHLYAFVMILGYSRCRYVEFTTRTDTTTFLRCHLNALAYFGGYPRELLYDNLKSVVLRRALRASDSQWNPQFMDFAHHFGIVPRLCHPYRPQTKGKVENLVKFVRSSFLTGRGITDLTTLNRDAYLWCNEVNQQIHGTTGVPPVSRLEEEALRPLEAVPPYVIVQQFSRRVSRECFVAFRTNRYSVPWRLAGREALLRTKDDQLSIEVAGAVVAQHRLHAGTHAVLKDPEHFAGLVAAIRRRNASVHQRSLSSFDPVPVEHRDLLVYDQLLEEDTTDEVNP